MPQVLSDHPNFNKGERFRIYNLWDCVATARAAPVIQQELKDNGQWPFWEREVWPLIDPVMAMAERGLLVDQDALSEYAAKVTQELAELDEGLLEADPTGTLRKPTGASPNGLGAGKRVAKVLFGERPEGLGLKVQKLTAVARDPSVDQDALLRVLKNLRKMDEHARPFLYDLIHRSRLKTIKQRYLKIPVDEDGRTRPTVKMGGTETGRFAYDRPALQQFPPEIRHIFVPAPGHTYVWADYSQLEARIAAYLAEDDIDIAVFDSGEDIHAQTARDLFDWDLADWAGLTADQRKAARNFAKTFRYGLLYGGKPETMKMKTYCPCPRCEDKLPPTLDLPKLKITESSNRWLGMHPQLTKWRDATANMVRNTKGLTNALGRKRIFFTPYPGCKREAYNWPIQSCAADIINRAMRKAHYEYQLPTLLQHHDSLMLEVPDGDVEALGVQLREVMEEPVPELGGVVFPVDLEWGPAWGVVA